MGLLDKLRAELIDIVEWTEPSQNDILAYRFPRYNNEIKMGAKLTVRFAEDQLSSGTSGVPMAKGCQRPTADSSMERISRLSS